MKSIELLEKYPLSTEVVRQWFFNEMMRSNEVAEDVPEEFKKAMVEEAISNDRLAIFIDAQPRGLFDVFDDNNIIIVIKYHDNFGFTWAVEEADEQSFYKTRREAESFAIEAAFEILEQRLNN
jgi:hypothetical protein